MSDTITEEVKAKEEVFTQEEVQNKGECSFIWLNAGVKVKELYISTTSFIFSYFIKCECVYIFQFLQYFQTNFIAYQDLKKEK